ncbi:MAG: hypothetical protein INR73_13760 [Williamsia sp.]|nr:hypothetical protein [Williamsia sp.]
MKIYPIAVALTVINSLLLVFLLAQLKPAIAQGPKPVQSAAPVLRGRGLEIVDSLGRIRASITIQPPVEVNGMKYTQTVLLRLIASNGKPMVKIGGAENGSGLTLIDESDKGVLINVQNDSSSIKITNKDKEQALKR